MYYFQECKYIEWKEIATLKQLVHHLSLPCRSPFYSLDYFPPRLGISQTIFCKYSFITNL